MESGKTESEEPVNSEAQDACRNHWLDKRAMRGQRVCVRVTGPVAEGGAGLCAGEPGLDRHPLSPAQKFNLGVSENSVQIERQ